MPTVKITLPDDVATLAEAEALRAGRTLDEYVADLIVAHIDQPVGATLEAELLKGLDTPGIEPSPQSWEDKKRRFEQRRTAGE